jgi:multiple sugar transport system substrate-binding protein
MTLKTVAGLAAAAVLALGALVESELTVSRQGKPGRVTVVYWEKWTGPEGIAMRKVVDDYNRSQDRIYVRYLSISGVDTKTLLATAGGDPPDVAGIWQDQLAQFADAKALTDLSQLAAGAGLTPNYYISNYWNQLHYHNGLWALPSTPASIALHVRSDLVPPDVASPATFPKTIEGLDRLSDRITRKSADGTLKLAGFLPSDPGWWNYAWGPLFGGKLVKGDQLTLNSPDNVKAFTWIAGYGKRYGSKEVQSFQSGFGNFESPQDPFMDGKVATEINGVWKGNYISSFRPELKGKWFAVPFPYPEDRPDLAGHAILSMDVLAIPTGCKHVKEAFDFIRYVQRQNVMERLCLAHGKNSPLNKVSEYFFEHHPNPYIRLFDKLARSKQAIGPYGIGIWRQLGDEINVAFQEVSDLSKTPQEALDDAQHRMNGEWATYKRQVLGN